MAQTESMKIEWERIRCPGVVASGQYCDNRILNFGASGEPNLAMAWNECCKKVFKGARLDMAPSEPAAQDAPTGRRRTIAPAKARDKVAPEAVESMLKRGLCPKCGKHVGRGIRFHHQHCKGELDADIRTVTDPVTGRSEQRRFV